jgi:hypothetical protein
VLYPTELRTHKAAYYLEGFRGSQGNWGNQPMVDELPSEDTKQFHGWRLIGVIMGVIVVLAIISALVDWIALK